MRNHCASTPSNPRNYGTRRWLEEDNLRELGVSLGDRKRLVHAIRTLGSKAPGMLHTSYTPRHQQYCT